MNRPTSAPTRILVVESDFDRRRVFLEHVEAYCARVSKSWHSTSLGIETHCAPPEDDCLFLITFANPGEDAVSKVCEAVADNEPFEVACFRINPFADLTFIQEVNALWRIDRDLQAIAIAGEGACDWATINEQLESDGRLFLLRDPLCADEICQLSLSVAAQRRNSQSIRRELRDASATIDELKSQLGQARFSENRLAHAAVHDSLTGLPNREFIRQLIAECATRKTAGQAALMFIDVDNFKTINDSLGHRVGDKLLVEFAKRLQQVGEYRQADPNANQTYCARLGGDEFVVLVKGLSENAEAERIALAMQEYVTATYKLEKHEINIGVSIGITFFEAGVTAAEQLMHFADLAMYRAKFGGKQCVAIYDEAMHRAESRRLYLETALRTALSKDQLSLQLQPIYQLADDKLIAVEALLRWTLDDGTKVSPDEFIPLAEHTGLILPIGRWVIEQACQTIVELNDIAQNATAQNPTVQNAARQQPEPIWVSINVSRRQLATPGFATEVIETLQRYSVDGEQLCIEVTEQTVLEVNNDIRENIEQLRAAQVRFFLDDFGTGQSSLTCLHKLPIDVVKIDRSFVSTMEANAEFECIVSAITTLAHSFGTKVVAEGIESEMHIDSLSSLGCDWGQGFHCGRPMGSEQFKALLQSKSLKSVLPISVAEPAAESTTPTL